MRNPATPVRFLLLLLVVSGILLSGCTVTNRLFRDREAEERAAALLKLQLAVMRFADEYTARISTQVGEFQRTSTDPAERLESQTWLVSQATAAVTIAAGPNVELNAIDMLVFTALSRMVIEDRWVGEAYGQRAQGLLAEHRALEKRIWEYSSVLLTEEQIGELRSAIDAWHRENPLLRAVPFVHLEQFEFATSQGRKRGGGPTSIFAFLGIDPLSNLDPAVRELAQTRQLAERAVYYGQRAPKLVSLEAQRLSFQFAVEPESVRLIDSVAQIGGAAETTGRLAADLPELLARERAAVFAEFTALLESREGELRSLTTELRSALEAGGTTSDSVRQTIAALDAFVARFDRREVPPGGTPPRPFDITEYTEAMRELGSAAQQLEALLDQADGKATDLSRLSDSAGDRLEALVDHVYWRLVQLVLVIAVASLAGALAWRAIRRRA